MQRRDQRAKWVHIVAVVFLTALCLAAWAIELRNLARDYVVPALRGQRGFINDFQFFYEGAQRFLTDPFLLYRVNTRNGYLLIEWNKRVDYGYPPPAVLWFVPLALVSLPVAYAAFMTLSAWTMPLCVGLVALLRRWEGGQPRRDGFWIVSLVFALACGMTYATIAFGQVNVWVLLLCLLYIACVMNGRFVTAGVLMGLGFWLKFYPVFLLALAPFEKKPIRLLLACGLGIVLIPLALQAILPLELYKEYFREIYPGLANQTSPHVYNQSLVAWLTRWNMPRDFYFDWGPLLVDPSIRLISGIAMLMFVAGVVVCYWRRRDRPFFCYAALLAVIPMVVTYGWGGTYLLALPFILLVWRDWTERGVFGWVLVAIAIGVFLLPAYRPLRIEPIWSVVSHVYYNRYLYAMALMLVSGMWRYVRQPSTAVDKR